MAESILSGDLKLDPNDPLMRMMRDELRNPSNVDQLQLRNLLEKIDKTDHQRGYRRTADSTWWPTIQPGLSETPHRRDPLRQGGPSWPIRTTKPFQSARDSGPKQRGESPLAPVGPAPGRKPHCQGRSVAKFTLGAAGNQRICRPAGSAGECGFERRGRPVHRNVAKIHARELVVRDRSRAASADWDRRFCRN